MDDQDKALQFYTEVLGFVKKTEFPLGEFRWLTVVSPGDPAAPNWSWSPPTPGRGPFTGRRWPPTESRPRPSRCMTSTRSTPAGAAGVQFTQAPAEMGPVTTAVFDDTCGNLIQIAHRAVDRGEVGASPTTGRRYLTRHQQPHVRAVCRS